MCACHIYVTHVSLWSIKSSVLNSQNSRVGRSYICTANPAGCSDVLNHPKLTVINVD